MLQVGQMKQQFLRDLAKRRTELYEQLSQYDNEEQDLLHFIENEKYDAVTMVKVAKLLKDNRLARRKIKVELEQLQSIRDTVAHRNLQKFAEKPYTYRTDVLSNAVQRTKGMQVVNQHTLFTKQND